MLKEQKRLKKTALQHQHHLAKIFTFFVLSICNVPYKCQTKLTCPPLKAALDTKIFFA